MTEYENYCYRCIDDGIQPESYKEWKKVQIYVSLIFLVLIGLEVWAAIKFLNWLAS